MGDHFAILALAVGLFVAFLIYKGVLAARMAKEERLRGLRALGFEPLPSPPADVTEPILALYPGKKKKITDVFERRGSSDRVYLFDLKDGDGDTSVHEAIAIFSPRLQLPRMTIFPRLEGEGHLAALGNLVLKKVAQGRGKTLDLESHPRFSKRHFVSGPDEAALRRFLTTDRLDRLATMEHVSVEGKGGVFTCQDVHFGRQKKRDRHDEVVERTQRAEEVLRALTRF